MHHHHHHQSVVQTILGNVYLNLTPFKCCISYMPTQKKKGCVSMFRMNTCASICWRSMPAQVSKQMQQYPLYRAQANLFFSSATEPLLKELRQTSVGRKGPLKYSFCLKNSEGKCSFKFLCASIAIPGISLAVAPESSASACSTEPLVYSLPSFCSSKPLTGCFSASSMSDWSSSTPLITLALTAEFSIGSYKHLVQ